jgi:DNA-binding transcriptional LysR family regulator
MQITVLRYFLEVIEQGSIRSAAVRMNITPSAISRHIRILERMVGASLFERMPRGMALTVEGEIFAKYAKRMVSNVDLIKSAIEEIKGLRRGVIRIFAIEAVASSVLYPAIRNFMQSHEGITFEVEIIARNNNDVLHALLREEADIGIMYKLNINPEIEYVREFETPFSVIVAPDHPLASQTSLSVRDLAGLMLAGLSPSSATRRISEEAMRAAGVQCDYGLVVNSFEMAKEFARTGSGVAILPEIAVRREQEQGTLVAIPLSEWSLRHIRCAVCTNAGSIQTRAVEAFLTALNPEMDKLRHTRDL